METTHEHDTTHLPSQAYVATGRLPMLPVVLAAAAGLGIGALIAPHVTPQDPSVAIEASAELKEAVSLVESFPQSAFAEDSPSELNAPVSDGHFKAYLLFATKGDLPEWADKVRYVVDGESWCLEMNTFKPIKPITHWRDGKAYPGNCAGGGTFPVMIFW